MGAYRAPTNERGGARGGETTMAGVENTSGWTMEDGRGRGRGGA